MHLQLTGIGALQPGTIFTPTGYDNRGNQTVSIDGKGNSVVKIMEGLPINRVSGHFGLHEVALALKKMRAVKAKSRITPEKLAAPAVPGDFRLWMDEILQQGVSAPRH